MKPKPKDITFHYTNEQMVKDLLAILPLKGCSVLDAGSGKNKVWYNNIQSNRKHECEIEDGVDFMEWTTPVDWVVGNPPYHIGWEFTNKAGQIAKRGVAWLVNNAELNSLLTPRRLQVMKNYGFEITHIRVVADRRWFGWYYFLVYEKKEGFISWNTKTY